MKKAFPLTIFALNSETHKKAKRGKVCERYKDLTIYKL